MKFTAALLAIATVVAAWPEDFSPNCTTSTIVGARGSERRGSPLHGHGGDYNDNDDHHHHDSWDGRVIEYPAVEEDGGVDTTCYAGLDQEHDGVKALQISINSCYFDLLGEDNALDVDGWYGPNTEEAVVAVQEALGFEGDDVDGIWGPDTGKAMEYHAISREGSACRRADV